MTAEPSGTNGRPAGTSGGDDRALYGALAVILALFGLVNATSDVMEWRDDPFPQPAWHSFLYEYSSVALWLALIPAFIWLQRRFPFQAPWAKTVAIHGLITLPVSLAHVAGMVAIRKIGFLIAYGNQRTYDFLGDAPAMTLLYEWRKDVLTYLMFSGFIWAWDRFRRPAPTPALPNDLNDILPRIEIRDGARTTFLPAAEAYWIEAAGNYVEVHTAGQTHLVRGTLAGFEEKLATAGFVRVHRSRLVNVRRIRTLAGTDAGDFTITLDDGRTVGGSRRYRAGVAPSRAP